MPDGPLVVHRRYQGWAIVRVLCPILLAAVAFFGWMLRWSPLGLGLLLLSSAIVLLLIVRQARRPVLFTLRADGIEIPGRATIAWSEVTEVSLRPYPMGVMLGFDVSDDAPRRRDRWITRWYGWPEWYWPTTALAEDPRAILGRIEELRPSVPVVSGRLPLRRRFRRYWAHG